ncbi:MAG TPA: ornithine carbamoyltransferase [Syntrophorhabdaceae bacterium]|nr:Ornithine carbamoyltransferase, anabolic [Syntrophorhabdaceae bacterium]HNQ63480.1 ornithine carbamoyltransferase [Syntrophorhabdaceae bacterium]HNZ58213.1 ornithine carbamoyltransferase [Syntrophorhabdaceae bacterium]HOB68519.1 ornithine carbamoyltransferase [Syntrophorhabdaceae bacterium]HOG39263.1 ornithine carbamoyltransferase [Syntrophorhabdaceae bacterium]
MKRDFTKILDISKDEGMNLLERARYLKDIRKKGIDHKPLKGKNIAMIFEKASTRTRVSFEVGIHDLGGNAVIMNANDMQLGRGEPVKDTARVLSRYVDAVMIRTYKQTVVDELANWASIPIINGLSDLYHPCQILSDLYTISEFRGSFENLKIIYIGDGNNVANSWIEASILFDLDFAMATPNNYKPLEKLVKMAEKNRRFSIDNDPYKVVNNADVINTDVWVSMGQEKEKKERKTAFALYKIDDNLLKKANNDVLVMHCLPAYRNQEIADSVFEKYQDVIFTQAENRLHVQKALLEWLLT